MEGPLDDFKPIEEIIVLKRVEFFVTSVSECTSRYNCHNSMSYSPYNLMGKYEKFPDYGDFPEVYCLRTYGTWWKESEGFQSNYRPQDVDPLDPQDYLIVRFESPVFPRYVHIYEVFNPGAIVRIWGKLVYKGELPWVLLWEGQPQTLPQRSRIFRPKIRHINDMINSLRLEFNQTHLEYHYSIDAILLGGFQPWTKLLNNILLNDWSNILHHKEEKAKPVDSELDISNISQDEGSFECLPVEVMMYIFSFLDLKSLSKCAQVNYRWNIISNDQSLYQCINLKPYWYLLDSSTLTYLTEKCKILKKLDLSWCGNERTNLGKICDSLIEKHAETLTHISLGSCEFVTDDIVKQISHCRELKDLRLKNIKYHIGEWNLVGVTKLISLDLTASDIKYDELIKILKANPELRHINVDLCEKLRNIDLVVEALTQFNKELVTWSSWKAVSLSIEGVRHFGKCSKLKELDLGWCLLSSFPITGLSAIAEGCPNLRRLILSECRSLNDQLIMPIITSCKQLTQLHFVGLKYITGNLCDKALSTLPNLRLLDISYCDMIRQEEVLIWRENYPNVKIHRSCQFASNIHTN